MKIITDTVAYVQRKELENLNQLAFIYNFTIPLSIYLKAFRNDDTNSNNGKPSKFVAFKQPDEIQYFKHIDWIMDYNAVKDLSEKEMIALTQKIFKEMVAITEQIQFLSKKEKTKITKLRQQYQSLEYKLQSTREILWFQQGHLKIELPEDIALPTEVEQTTEMKQFIKTIFHKSNEPK